MGQTFVAQYDGLSAIGLLVKPGTAESGTVKISLFSSPGKETILRQAELPISRNGYPGYTYFYFQPVPNSNQGDYYFSVQFDGDGTVYVGMADGAAYLKGAAYLNRQPQDAQLTFETIYGPRLMLTGLLKEIGLWLVWIAAGIFLFILPGWAILSIVFPGWKLLNLFEKAGLSSGISLAIYPLLMLWTNLLNLRISAGYAWLPPLCAIAVIGLRHRKNLRSIIQRRKKSTPTDWPELMLWVIIGMLAAVRFWVIRSIDFPLWGDSYQHTLIAQLLVDQGGLFNSWEPYARLLSFTYHFGFHSLAAAFHWITGMSLPQSVLWTGQILNILVVLSLYPISRKISKNPWAGVFTVLLAGLIFSMPMYFLNWGRYTQLAGLIIMSTWIVLAWRTFEKEKIHWSFYMASWIVLGGLALTHYRVFIFAAIFIPAYSLLNFQLKKLVRIASRSLWIFVGAVILSLPWYINTFAGKLVASFTNQLATPASNLSQSTLESYSIGNLFFYLPAWTWIILPFGIGIALWKRKFGIALMSLWWYLILLAANPQWLNLPGAGILTSFAVMIAAFYPVSIILGDFAAWIITILQEFVTKTIDPKLEKKSVITTWLPITICILILAFGFYGASQRLTDIDVAQNALAVRPDQRAAEWIRENTPLEAGFLVNSFAAYQETAIVGADGGWWLPLLTERATTLPPLPYLSEKGPRPDYRQWINLLTNKINENGIDHPSVLNELSDRGIGYVYIGQQHGQVNNPEPLIKLDHLIDNPHFEPVYHQDRVWIFKINPQQVTP